MKKTKVTLKSLKNRINELENEIMTCRDLNDVLRKQLDGSKRAYEHLKSDTSIKERQAMMTSFSNLMEGTSKAILALVNPNAF
jgi:predicted RNase H-like nuclease (RuvC/YqgF family)